MNDYKRLKNKYYKIISPEAIEKNKINFDIFLYLTTAHLTTQTRRPIIYFHFYRNTCSSPAAIFQCTTPSDGVCQSPASAPFGSIQCLDDCSIEEIDTFVKMIIRHLEDKGAKELQIRHYANCYAEIHAKHLSDIFLANGFQCSQNNVNHHIPVSAKEFRSIISPAERRRLKKCERAAFTTQIATEIAPEMIYHFLIYCRSIKNYQLSLSQSQLKKLMTTFPTQVRAFTVRSAEGVIALAVTIRVNTQILYNFLADSLPEYGGYSPAVMLTECIYNYCRQEEIGILDLGTSMDQWGREKQSLIRFKEHMGGIRSNKMQFVRRF